MLAPIGNGHEHFAQLSRSLSELEVRRRCRVRGHNDIRCRVRSETETGDSNRIRAWCDPERVSAVGARQRANSDAGSNLGVGDRLTALSRGDRAANRSRLREDGSSRQ